MFFFSFSGSLNSHNNIQKDTVIPILYKKKPRLREIKLGSRSHTEDTINQTKGVFSIQVFIQN